VEDRADVPLVGGPWLWTTFGSELLDADVEGTY
jgi:hypothetical protein